MTNIIRTCRCLCGITKMAGKGITSNSLLYRPMSSATTSAEGSLVIEEDFNGVRLISINRPQVRNCVNSATAKALRQAFENFNDDQSVNTAVLYGKGGTFCAGYDLKELSAAQDLEYPVDHDQAWRPMGPTKMVFKKPVVAAIEGYAVAGGLELACMCDLRVAEDTAVMGVFSRRFGVPLLDGGTVRLPHLIGLSHAMDLILTGREVKATEAKSIGLVNLLVPTGAALGEALKIAKRIGRFPQKCMLADRESAYNSAYASESFNQNMNFEWQNGTPVIAQESIKGATEFAVKNIGKHGYQRKLKSIKNK